MQIPANYSYSLNGGAPQLFDSFFLQQDQIKSIVDRREGIAKGTQQNAGLGGL